MKGLEHYASSLVLKRVSHLLRYRRLGSCLGLDLFLTVSK